VITHGQMEYGAVWLLRMQTLNILKMMIADKISSSFEILLLQFVSPSGGTCSFALLKNASRRTKMHCTLFRLALAGKQLTSLTATESATSYYSLTRTLCTWYSPPFILPPGVLH